jgi:hypothetical protein
MNIIDFDTLRDNFLQELDNVVDREELIDSELKCVNHYIEFKKGLSDPIRTIVGRVPNIFTVGRNQVFRLGVLREYRSVFSMYFNNYSLYGKKDYQEPEPDDRKRHVMIQAVFFVEYYNWLKSLRGNKNSKKQNSNLTLNQKMIVMSYIGVDLGNMPNTSTAKMLSLLLDVGEENLRKNLSYIHGKKNQIRNKKNLTVVKNFFESCGLEDLAQQADAELKEYE